MGALIMGPLMPGLLQNMGSLKLGFPVLGSLEAAQRSFEYTYLFHYHFSRYTVFPDIPCFPIYRVSRLITVHGTLPPNAI